MAYCPVFLYRIPKGESEAFVQALRPIMRLFEESGCLSEALLRPRDMKAKYGVLSRPAEISLAEDYDLFEPARWLKLMIPRISDQGSMGEFPRKG